MLNRRHFLKHASCAAVGSTTLLNTILNLRAIGAETFYNSSVASDGDYKALICLTMGGGNDSFNMLLPGTSEAHAEYMSSRGNIAIAADQMLPLNPLDGASGDFGLHPSLTNMQSLFQDGHLGFVANIGSMIEPINTKQDFSSGLVTNPLGLFSHADMQQHWQTAMPSSRENIGWGGRMADLLTNANEDADLPMNISLSGSNTLQNGLSSSEFAVDPVEGAVGLSGYNTNNNTNTIRSLAVDNIIDATYVDIFEKTYMNTIKAAKDGGEVFSAALSNITPFVTEFSDTGLSNAFSMIANIIAARDSLAVNRQIFFVELAGWDHHDDLILDHAAKLSEVDAALGEFKSAMDEINMFDCVTTFSVSEFGRKLTTNGDGSDHAWGGNAFMMGGAVNGQRIYGQYPSLSLDGDRVVNSGVVLPTTSADEYLAELALWYGVPASSLVSILPNIGTFYSPMSGVNPIGFMPPT